MNMIYLIDKKLIRKDFQFSTDLFLKFRINEIINESTISNLLLHLFFCPRSFFAKNSCQNCSRKFIVKDIYKPPNFHYVLEFDFRRWFSEHELFPEILDDIREFNGNVFFDSQRQLDIVNSDRQRCLDTFVVQEHFEFGLLFAELQLRVFMNFFYGIVDDIFDKREKKLLIRNAYTFTERVVSYSIKNMNLKHFEKLFDEINYSQFQFIKVINKKYIDSCIEKYAD